VTVLEVDCCVFTIIVVVEAFLTPHTLYVVLALFPLPAKNQRRLPFYYPTYYTTHITSGDCIEVDCCVFTIPNTLSII
jgi:hypothetical protein